ncbi:MAG: hypothetical protein J6K04_12855 [Lachnospiraceae bacterium]|nr:hypothetical protein [Lachnospiraceae bacterium]
MMKLVGRLKICGYAVESRGLSSNQIKWIALVAMTIDHLAAYGFEIPMFGAHFDTLRIIGRIAAPLFFFALTESVKHTRSKTKLILRLYLGAVGTGLFVAVTNLLFHDSIGRFAQSNILCDYIYTVLYIVLTEQIIEGIRKKQWKWSLLAVAGILATGIPHVMVWLIYEFPYGKYGLSPETVWTIQDFAGSFIFSPLAAEYTILFVIMGILMYFAGNKYGKVAVLVLFSCLCYFGGNVEFLRNSMIGTALGYPQYYMIFAVPFLLLYNGEKGRGNKYFFYVYYPVHRYVISVAVFVYRLVIN